MIICNIHGMLQISPTDHCLLIYFCLALERRPPPPSETINSGLIAGIVVAAGILCFILVGTVFYIKRRGSNVDEEIGIIKSPDMIFPSSSV